MSMHIEENLALAIEKTDNSEQSLSLQHITSGGVGYPSVISNLAFFIERNRIDLHLSNVGIYRKFLSTTKSVFDY